MIKNTTKWLFRVRRFLKPDKILSPSSWILLSTIFINVSIIVLSQYAHYNYVTFGNILAPDTLFNTNDHDSESSTICAASLLPGPVNIVQNQSLVKTPCTWPRPKNRNVFLIETVKDFAIPKVLCTLESAARHTPDFCVTLMIVNHAPPMKQIPILQEIVDSLPNVEIINIGRDDLVVETPFEGFFRTEKFLQSKWSFNYNVHLSDIGRAALLWKYGGVYIDLDLIVLKSLDQAPEYVARTPHGGIANGLMKFNANNPLLLRYLANMWTDYDPDAYSRLFYVLLESVEEHCRRKGLDIKGIKDVPKGVKEVEDCDGIKIFGRNSGLFEPFKTDDASRTIFNDTHGELFEGILKREDPTVLHYAGNSKGHYRTKMNVRDGDSLFARMFRKHCPIINARYFHV